MATEKRGRINGSIGNIVHYTLGDKNVMRQKPAYVHNPRTTKQQNHRAKIRESSKFIRSIHTFIKIGYQATSLDYPSNEARQFLIRNCFIETPEGMLLNYPSVPVSRGELKKPEEFGMTTNGTIATITWKSPVKQDFTDGTDKVMIIMYSNETTEGMSWLKSSVAFRADGKAILDIPAHELPIHVWMFFYNAEKAVGESRKKISDSVYLGELNS